MPVVPAHYIGPISRLEKAATTLQFSLAIVLSGPEPQRTLLEKKIAQQLHDYSAPTLLVRGLPNGGEKLQLPKNVQVVDHLASEQLSAALSASEMVVCRSGYSTVMDLCKLHKHAILIPTPGQTEQQYLATYLQERQWCLTYAQDEFNLSTAMNEAAGFSFRPLLLNMELYKEVIDEIVDQMQFRASASSATFAGK